jgi:hypothetical protein
MNFEFSNERCFNRVLYSVLLAKLTTKSLKTEAKMVAKKKSLGDPPSAFVYENGFVIQPRRPIQDGIFHLGPDVLVASHPPHSHVREHLHDHLHHMHIRYGFEIPQQSLSFIPKRGLALEVAMDIKINQRVDCNPVFISKGEGAEGICLKIAGQDLHWVHNEKVGKKATKLFQATGRSTSKESRFIGFTTSDMEERKVFRYSKAELKEAIGAGLRADQHFQATWIEPRNEPIAPYEVVIFLSDDVTNYHTFFKLTPTISIGAV